MAQTALVIMLLGVLVAVIGWLMGGSRPARSVREATGGLNGSARSQLAERGLDTGAFGAWLGRNRVLVRTLIAVLAVLWLFAMRPLSIGDIVLVLVVALLVGWILELLQRRDDAPVPDAAPDGTDTAVLTDANAMMMDDGTVQVDPDATQTAVLVDAAGVDAGAAPPEAAPGTASTTKKTTKR
jgi:hypothetical protein